MFKKDVSVALRRTRAGQLRNAPDRAAIKRLIAAVQRQSPASSAKVDRAAIDRLTTGALSPNTVIFDAFCLIMGMQMLFFAMWMDMEHNKGLK